MKNIVLIKIFNDLLIYASPALRSVPVECCLDKLDLKLLIYRLECGDLMRQLQQ